MISGKIRDAGVRLSSKARLLKKEVKVLYLVYKNPEVPWYAKLCIGLAIGYALSPIDLIPDFIPVLGYLDDLIIVPILIVCAIKLTPKKVMDECRSRAEDIFKEGIPKNWTVGVLIILLWIVIIGLVTYKIFRKIFNLKG